MGFLAKVVLIGIVGFIVVTALYLLGEWLTESGVPWGYRISILIGFLISVVVAIMLNFAGSAGQWAPP